MVTGPYRVMEDAMWYEYEKNDAPSFNHASAEAIDEAKAFMGEAAGEYNFTIFYVSGKGNAYGYEVKIIVSIRPKEPQPDIGGGPVQGRRTFTR